MKVIAYKRRDGLFIPLEQLSQLKNQDFTELKLDIKIIQYKNESVSQTSGLLSGHAEDGVGYQNAIRDEWNERI